MRYACLLVLLTVHGCANRIIVVRQDVDAPLVSVLPSDHTAKDAEFAEFVEREAMAFGAKIVERPAFRFANTAPNQEATASSGGGLLSFASESRSVSRPITDVVSMYEDAKADYLIITQSRSGGLRIIRRKDRTLVGSMVFKGGNRAILRHALVRAGIVKNERYVSEFCRVPTEPEMSAMLRKASGSR